MLIAMSKTREKFPLRRKKILKKTITASIGPVLLLSILFGFGAFIVLTGPKIHSFSDVGAGILAVFLLLGVFVIGIIALIFYYQRWYYAVYFYDLTSDYVIIRKGPITPQEVTIPYERIQDVYVSQDILDRIFGLYDVWLSSATISSGMQAHIDGLEKNAAEGFRSVLLQKIRERISAKQSAPTLL